MHTSLKEQNYVSLRGCSHNDMDVFPVPEHDIVAKEGVL